MKKSSIPMGAMLMLAAQVALAQAPTPSDTTGKQTQTPAAAPAPPPPSAAAATKPQFYKFGGISGSWLKPSGDFDKVASDGWAITLEGFQFITPTKKIAVGSQVGYQSFGKKNGVGVSNFPVDAVLKFYPKPGSGKADIYGTGGLGFNYMRTEVGHSTSSDYFFGTQAGAGVELHTSGPASLMVDAVYHWVFSNGTDTNFLALRGGLVIPMMR
jgi:hypothetical protein